MIKNNIDIIIWWCCQSVHCKEKTSYDHGVQNVPEHSSKNLHLLLYGNKVEFLQGRFHNKSFPCPQKEKWGFFRTFLFYLCVLTESLSSWNAEFWSWKPLHGECTAAILLTLSQHVSPWNTPVLPTQHGGAREGDQGRWGIVWRCKEGLHGRLTPQQRKNNNKKYLPDAISTSRSRSSYMYSFSWKSGSCKIQSHYFTNIRYVAWGK